MTGHPLDDLARAAFAAVESQKPIQGAHPQTFDGQYGWTKDAWRIAVRATLEAARNATPEMTQAGADEINPYARDGVSYQQTCEAVLDAWRAMIDKRLAT